MAELAPRLAVTEGGTGLDAVPVGALLVGRGRGPLAALLPKADPGDVLTTDGHGGVAWAAPGAGSGDGLGPDGDKGDITVGGAGTTLTIDNDAVTYAKIQNVSATDKILGRSTAGAGDIEEIACTAAGRALLDDADAAAQRATLGLGLAAVKDVIMACKTSDEALDTSSYTDIAGLTLSGLTNGDYYRFEFWIIADSNATTTGIDVSVNSAVAANVLQYDQVYWTTASAQTVRGASAYDNDTGSTASCGTTSRIFRVQGVVSLNGNGSVVARTKREGVGSGPTIRAGSHGIAWKLT